MLKSELWCDRMRQAKDSGKESFLYEDLNEMWGITTANISVSLKQIEEEVPGSVFVEKDGQRNVFRFDYALLIGDGNQQKHKTIPEWMVEETFNSVMSRLDSTSYDIVLTPMPDWVKQYQRGGVIASIHEKGQKHPLYRSAFRIDNCVIINYVEKL